VVHRLVVSYRQPADPAAFDAYYRGAHTPLALEHGLVRLTSGHAASLESPEGRAAGKDLANFATGGVSFTHFDLQTASSGR
jgi:hypothetical protein